MTTPKGISRVLFFCLYDSGALDVLSIQKANGYSVFFFSLGNVGVATGFALAQGDVGGVAIDDGGELLAQIDTVE